MLILSFLRTGFSDIVDLREFNRHARFSVGDLSELLGDKTIRHVPVPVRLSENSSGFRYAECLVGGADLVFTDCNGVEIPSEVDYWDPNGESLVWVRLPELSKKTVFCCHYGRPDPLVRDPCAVWDEHVDDANSNPGPSRHRGKPSLWTSFITVSNAFNCVVDADPYRKIATLTVPSVEHVNTVGVFCGGEKMRRDGGFRWLVPANNDAVVAFAAETGYELDRNVVTEKIESVSEKLSVFPSVKRVVLPADGLKMEEIAEYPIEIPGCSGITSVDDGHYYVVQDHAEDGFSRLHPLTIEMNLHTGTIVRHQFGMPIRLADNTDSEDLAYDKTSGGLWVCDEVAKISEFGSDGEPTGRTVPLPEIQRVKKRQNKSIEALSMAEDGLVMWSANEEALVCDGESSEENIKVSTVVRLMRFSRTTPEADWVADGEWAYACDPCEGKSYAQSGLSGLCALPDGTVLVLEREVSRASWGRCRIYRVTPYALSKATDVSEVPSLLETAYAGVPKGIPLVDFTGSWLKVIVYEGIALGPKLKDGSRTVFLLSDGGLSKSVSFLTADTVSRIAVFRLSGLKED